MSDNGIPSGQVNVDAFGSNEDVLADQYDRFIKSRTSVDPAWWPVLEEYAKQLGDVPPTSAPNSAPQPAAPQAAATPAPINTAPVSTAPQHPTASPANVADEAIGFDIPEQAVTTAQEPTPTPLPADRPSGKAIAEQLEHTLADVPEGAAQVAPMRGVAKSLAKNMDISLSVPTATSVRTLPAKVMIDNRTVINRHLSRARGGKVSFTHLIGWALVKALVKFPSMNVHYEEIDGKPAAVTPDGVSLGIAIDLPKPDGTRSLMVPGIKHADTLSFNEFLVYYEDLVKRARGGKLTPGDFAGVTVSLTNPGGIGTEHSVPRLMKGQAAIIGAGALQYPAEYKGASTQTLNDLGISKTITLTSTYDHRVIQGAGSGEFLKIVESLLLGADGFYDDIFSQLRIPYEPVRWVQDFSVDLADELNKTSRVQEIIHAYRVRGHLMADVDPLEYKQRKHPDLDLLTYGLSLWDLDREFITGGFSGRRVSTLREILGTLRDAYCRTIGIEYMHIQDPDQRRWLQFRIEQHYAKPTREEQLRILKKVSQAEAFETFLQTKYVGQKRFSLEGGESVIALLDGILQEAADDGVKDVGIGMAHRGRLNVLTNVAGKTYAQVFREFEGTQTPNDTQGSGDVKYHLGTEGTFTSSNGEDLNVYLAANPSHLEVVSGVLEGIMRAKQDRINNESQAHDVLPLVIHGDAAVSGQGSVYEVLQMSKLRGYQAGGTIHVIVNNQIGFTTKPKDGRSSVYPSDVGRSVQAPIFHVNGDDPEAVVHVAQLAYQFRQRFNTDVFIDLVCYRLRGHNEGDDPSMTQPLMYGLIEAKRSVRKLYLEALVGRGDITAEEGEQANKDFRAELERAFQETHEAQTGAIPLPHLASQLTNDLERPQAQRDGISGSSEHKTAISQRVVDIIASAHGRAPAGFAVHPKLQKLLDRRIAMSKKGNIDWAFAELIALGSLLIEGIPVRFSGQDSRRGTFVQRHAVLHDQHNGQEWLPLSNLTTEQARFSIYDSLLSEFGVLGFEYGYSVERTDALVIWEAQFGDFMNGAQTVIDEFIASAEQKWNQHSSLVMLLPHGYEGQGPDHSSARIERFLQLCAQNNMTVAQPSSPASYFHLLRKQAYQRPQRPLIVFSPKSMLRNKSAVSQIADLTGGEFTPVIDDPRQLEPNSVTRVVLMSGKLYWELKKQVEKQGRNDIALVRVEQYYPVPFAQVNAIVDRYPNAELVWAQEEPENQGAWPFIVSTFVPFLHNRTISHECRPASASPATGSHAQHDREQQDLVSRALGD